MQALAEGKACSKADMDWALSEVTGIVSRRTRTPTSLRKQSLFSLLELLEIHRNCFLANYLLRYEVYGEICKYT